MKQHYGASYGRQVKVGGRGVTTALLYYLIKVKRILQSWAEGYYQPDEDTTEDWVVPC